MTLVLALIWHIKLNTFKLIVTLAIVSNLFRVQFDDFLYTHDWASNQSAYRKCSQKDVLVQLPFAPAQTIGPQVNRLTHAGHKNAYKNIHKINFANKKIMETMRNLPSSEKKTAPTRLINGSRLGIAAATPPLINIIPVRKSICVLLWYCSLNLWLIFLQRISLGM